MTDVRYAVRNGVHIAYRTAGAGPLDVMLVPMWFSNLDLLTEYPAISKGAGELAGFARLIMWDRPGSGLSDRAAVPDRYEEWVEDLIAVLDAAGSERAALFGYNESGALAVLAAARYPERVSHLVVYGSYATTVRKDDYPWAPTPEEREQQVDALTATWGNREIAMGMLVGSGEDAIEWGARWMRNSVSRGMLRAHYDLLATVDVRAELEQVRAPTLVLHRSGDVNVPVDNCRYIAARIPGAKLVEFPGTQNAPFLGDWDTISGEIEEFLTGSRRPRAAERALATLMFVDIVGSTELAGGLGDRRWRELLDRYDSTVAAQLSRFDGKLVKSTGDGSLATFELPARAIACAGSLRAALGEADLAVRTGIHTGEVERRGDDVGGIAVHIAARVMDAAGPGQILVSGAVPPLVAGSGISLADRGSHRLRGVEGEWKLFEVAG